MHENHVGIRNPSKVLARPMSRNVIENTRFIDLLIHSSILQLIEVGIASKENINIYLKGC